MLSYAITPFGGVGDADSRAEVGFGEGSWSAADRLRGYEAGEANQLFISPAMPAASSSTYGHMVTWGVPGRRHPRPGYVNSNGAHGSNQRHINVCKDHGWVTYPL